ncbi:MAG: acyl carrier protein [Bacteroidota bacterium]|nr:acyl carrier protein [Bacteroidota bacterium]
MGVLDKIIGIISEVAGCNKDEITETTNLIDLGLDSLDIINIEVDLEDEFGIDVPYDVGQSFETVEDVVFAVKERMGQDA